MAKAWLGVATIAAAGLSACSDGSSPPANQQAAAKPTAPPPPHCFFKPDEMKGWTAAVGKDGNVTVKAKLYRSDGRYQAIIVDPKVSGATATVRPSIIQNQTGYSAPENWWPASFTIPNSQTVESVDVRCGETLVANLPIRRK